MNNRTTLAIFAAIAIVVVMVVGINIIVSTSVALPPNICKNKESNPNCFVPRGSNNPSICAEFIPGYAGNKP